MTHPIRRWTRQQAAVVGVAGLALAYGSLAVHGDPDWVLVESLGVMLATILMSVANETFIGLLSALAGGAALVASERSAQTWVPADFGVHLGEVVVLVGVSLVAGIAGGMARNEPRARAASLTTSPAKLDRRTGFDRRARGPLGLLASPLGEARLEEEVERAQYAGDPLTVVRLKVDLLGAPPNPHEPLVLHRAVVRVLESTLHVIDVPFAYAPDDIVVIMPETDAVEARVRADRVLRALHDASFTIRPSGARYPFDEYACLHVGIAAFPEEGRSARALLDGATAALQHLPVERGDTGGRVEQDFERINTNATSSCDHAELDTTMVAEALGGEGWSSTGSASG